MTSQNYFTYGGRQFDLIRAWNPVGSMSWVGIVDLTDPNDKRLIRLVRWGEQLFVPTYLGMEYGILVYNGYPSHWMGYPAYVGGESIYEGGSSDPDQTSSSHMWELRPGEWMIIGGVQNGCKMRPFVVVPGGAKKSIGELYNSPAKVSDIVVFERKPLGTSLAPEGDFSQGLGDPGLTDSESYTRTMFNTPTNGTSGQVLAEGEAYDFAAQPWVGTGLGEERIYQAYPTGRDYQPNAQAVAFVQMMPREYAQPWIEEVLGSIGIWTWDEPLPTSRLWFYEPWSWRQSESSPKNHGERGDKKGVMPDVTLAEPEAQKPGRHHFWNKRTRRWDW